MNEEKITKVCTKLLKARTLFHSVQIKKTGENQFAKYFYFELSDFLPQALAAFSEFGLVGIVSFTSELATLLIVDTESGERYPITAPLSEASLRGCHPVQNLGAVMTYQRRYLWAAAMELIEADPVDSSQPKDGVASDKLPTRPQNALPRAPQRESAASEKSLRWQGFIDWDEKKTFIYKGKKANGESYSLYRVTLVREKGEPERTATTFSEELWQKLQATGVEDEVFIYIKPNQKKAGTYELLGIETAQQELGDEQTWE